MSDFAGLLSPADRERIEGRLVAAERGTTTQVAVAVFPGLDGEDAADFTNRLFDSWKLGRASDNNGVLLALYVADRKVRIEVGYGFEGKLTDAVSRRIIEREIAPGFRKGDWAGGIEAGCIAILAATRGEYAAAPRKQRQGGGIVVTLLIFFLLFILPRILANAQATTYGPGGIRRRGRFRTFGGWGGGPWLGGGMSGGGMSGGGFSGGGGMSGGGGASGSW